MPMSLDQQREEDARYVPGIEYTDEVLTADVGDIPDELQENPDGSVTIPGAPDPGQQGPQEFLQNLAEVLDEKDLNRIATDLKEKLDRDAEARKKRDKQYAEGLERSGLSGDAPGGASFEGASKAVHPVLAESCVDFAAAAIKEIFPPDGPAKAKIVGSENDERRLRAKKKVEFLNWQYTEQIEDYRDSLEQLLSQLPMGGSQYQKYRYDDRLARPAVEFVPVDEVLLPYAASSFYTAGRVTHVQKLTRSQFDERVKSGLYKYDGHPANELPPDQSDAKTANDAIEGLEESCYNEDGLRTIYEIYTWLTIQDPLTGGKDEAPYIVTIDDNTEKTLAIYRNWAEQDQRRKKLDWWVEWGFLPWRGAYKLGLPHLIGGLSVALTGALRALLDSAHINNSAAAVKLKGGRTSGQNVQVEVTQVQELEAPAGVDDIRKLIMPMPFNPPSPVLFELLGWLTEAAKGVVSTAEEKIADASNQMPVGTTLALIEQGSKVYSAIHARLHASQAKGMAILCRINATTLNDQEVMAQFGEQIVTRQDFTNNNDVRPVSDPNIFSEAQRFARWQAILQMTQDPTVQWNKVEIYREGLSLMKVEEVDKFLPAPPKPVTADQVQENVAAVLQGVPLQAHPQQDHMAHVMEHLRFILDPLQGGAPGVNPQALSGILNHCQQHLMFLYANNTMMGAQQMAQQAMMAGMQPQQEQLIAQAAQAGAQALQQQMPQLVQMLQQAAQLVQSKMPPAPMDPAQASLQAAMAETQRRAQLDQMTMQFKQQEAQRSDQFKQLELQMQQQADAFKQQMEHMAQQQAAAMSHLTQQTELMKNDADNRQHQLTELLKNRDDNETAVVIAELKNKVAAMQAQPQTPAPVLNFDVSEALQQALKPYAEGLGAVHQSVSGLSDSLGKMMEGQATHQQRIMDLAQQLMQQE